MIRRRWAAFCDGFWDGFTGIYIRVLGKDAQPPAAPIDDAARKAEEVELWGDIHPELRAMAIAEQEDARTHWLTTETSKRKEV